MKERKQPEKGPEVVWHEERKTLTLEGEPVLEYALSWPEVTGAGLGGRWISRFYAHMAKTWRLRWQREIYWRACLELAERRAASRPFTPWSGRLRGEVTLLEHGTLSLRLEGEEIRGDGKPCRVRWGDVWNVREGAPRPLKPFFRGERGWKKRLMEQIRQQGERRREAGDCFLDPGWERSIRGLLPEQDFCLTPEGVEFAFPQGAVAPAAEGTPVFCVPLPAAEAGEGRPRPARGAV